MEKKTNVYYIPGTDAQGAFTYAYAVCSALLHEQMVEAVRLGTIPDFAVIVEAGTGQPSEETKARIAEYYGFTHEAELE